MCAPRHRPYRRDMASPSRPGRVRRILLGAGALALTLVLAIAGLVTWTWARADVSTVGTTEFARPLLRYWM